MIMQAIYPTVVIALVNSHRTLDYMYSTNASLPTTSHDPNPHHTTTIRFAEPDPATSLSASKLSHQIEKGPDIQGT